MKYMILAAGYATRLYPLTENFPKPVLALQEKTILDWLIDDVDSSGQIDEYVVISNHKYVHHFDAWVKTKTQKIAVVDDGTESNESRLGAIKNIQFAIDKLGLDDDILVIAGGNLLDFSLIKFVDYTYGKKASCVMRYYEPSGQRLLKCGVVTVEKNDRFLRMTEKSPNPETHWCCPPFYYYTKADTQLVQRALKQDVIPMMRREVLLTGCVPKPLCTPWRCQAAVTILAIWKATTKSKRSIRG